jgi:hypothetical protein
MESFLQAKGLYKFITERASVLRETYADNAEKLEELLENDERALGFMKRSMELCHLDVVADCKSAYSAWKKLEEFFAGKENFNVVNLLQQLTLEVMSETGDIVKDVQNFVQSKNDLVRRLGYIGFKIEEKLQVALMLAQLPSSFETLRRIMESQAELSLSQLVAELHRESIRRGQSYLKRSSDEIVFLSAEEIKKKKKAKLAELPTCSFCVKKGHRVDQCWINPDSPAYRKELVEKIISRAQKSVNK